MNMKIKTLLGVPLLMLVMASCNYLDFDETSGRRTREDMTLYFYNMDALLVSIYSYLPQDLGTIGGAMRDCATDDAEFGTMNASVQGFNNGTWSAINNLDSQFSLYNAIREANDFLVLLEDFDISRFAYDVEYQQWAKKLQYFPYEARVLRAYYFFELARRYGDIPMPLKVMTLEEGNSIAKTRFDDVIDFIVSECEQCAPELPDTYEDVTGQIGRVTKGFAMAVKSKALLYAASKLHNPNGDVEKWKKSAKAAYDIIKYGKFQLDPKGVPNRIESPEAVLFRMNGSSSWFEQQNFPVRFTKGKRSNLTATTYPSQNLVDAFETIRGYKVVLGENGWVTDDPNFDVSSPYENRDPRLARTVLANGHEFKGERIETYSGGADDFSILEGGSPTGYFLRKYIIDEVDFTPNAEVTKNHFWVIYRYAETLLTYAESMIYAFSDPDYVQLPDYPKSALWALNEVRTNAGMPHVTVTDKEEFIQKLRNEWRVEFAFEDHRFWDVRRWMIGKDTQEQLDGVQIEKSGEGFTYKRFNYESRKWDEKMNLFPIPQRELYVNPNLFPQNAGW